MTKPNEQYAYFSVVGDFDPDEISKRVGISPSFSWKRGEVNVQTQLERKSNRWSLYSRLDKTEPLENHVRDVLEQLEANLPEFQKLTSDFEGTLQLVGYFYTTYPGFSLDRGAVRAAAVLGLELDCDFYYLYSDKRENS